MIEQAVEEYECGVCGKQFEGDAFEPADVKLARHIAVAYGGYRKYGDLLWAKIRSQYLVDLTRIIPPQGFEYLQRLARRCLNPDCGKIFYSADESRRFCSRSCSHQIHAIHPHRSGHRQSYLATAAAYHQTGTGVLSVAILRELSR